MPAEIFFVSADTKILAILLSREVEKSFSTDPAISPFVLTTLQKENLEKISQPKGISMIVMKSEKGP